jgi:hypothetical protein
MYRQRWNLRTGFLISAFVLLLCAQMFAGVTASISGTVKDQSGAAIAGATVKATNVGTGIAQTQTTNAQGFYSFQALPLGKYVIDIQQKGFKAYRQTDLTLDVNSALMADATLPVGLATEKVEVAADALHVETVNSQMGEVIESKRMTDVPLLSRSYTDLLSLQPGVASAQSQMTGAYAGPFISAGFAPPLVSGDLNAGAYSVNGMREAANGFILNGMLVQELGYSGAGAVPNLDSIQEFRILTNNVDAEFGNYAGAQINVVTKSGTNQWHGNVFEFLRNTNLNARNYFDPAGQKGAYHQNQFGGTFGGPIVRDKIFFFADYQGNRLVQGKPQTIPNVPSSQIEGGDFSGIAAAFDPITTNNFVTQQPVATTVNGSAWATQLTSQLLQTVTPGEPYYFTKTDYMPNSSSQFGVDCTSATQCVFPNAQMSSAAFNPISQNLLKYILPADPSTVQGGGLGTFSTSSGKVDLHDNKFSGRVDANSRFGLLTAYYFFDRFDRVDPYWPSNFPLYPGFSVDSKGQTHNITVSDVKTLSSASVNELRIGYFRLNTRFNQPLGGTGVTLADLGFASGANGGPGVYIGTPGVEGVPEIDFNNFVIGVPSRPNQLITNIYQVSDSFSKVFGTHTIKFGGQYHFNQLEENLSNVANGNFGFGSNFTGNPSETGSDFVDFLLGAPSGYIQGQSYPSYGRSYYFGLFGQDSWRMRPNLTLNFGLRYDVSSPFYEKYNEIQSIRPGQQSKVFPGSPAGWVFPGDSGVPRGLAPTRWNNFAPRIGLAYSFGDHEGAAGKLLGKSGTSSIRVGYTLAYASFEGATDFNEIGDAPFGNYTGQAESTFAAPFINRATGNCAVNLNPGCGNLFPVAPPPKHVSPSHPASGPPYDTLAEFLNAFGTIGSSPAFYYGNRLPYTEDYEVSFQRQLTNADLLTLSYVGTQGHRLLSSVSANPGNPALCLSLSQPSDVAPGTATCGPSGESSIYLTPTNTAVLGTRPRLPGLELTPAEASAGLNGPIGTLLPDGNYGVIPFANDSYFITGGKSSYNSLQMNYRHTSRRLQTMVGYTYSKSLDISSGYGEQYNPVNPNLSRGLSAWDQTHNFVMSYTYLLPFDQLGGPKRLTNGWSISGVSTFSTGLPVTLVENDDHSLLGTAFGGPITLAVDTPDQVGPLQRFNPRDVQTIGGVAAHYYFDPSVFQPSAVGSEGNTTRRFFHGPGINNWNMAFHKDTAITERVNLQFRADFFNIFNHAQFATPLGILGGAVGQVTSTSELPRTAQLSLKLNF